MNGTYALSVEGKEGAMELADPRLRKAISSLCSIRAHSLGTVTALVRAARKRDTDAARQHRGEKRKQEEAEAERLAANRLSKANANMETELVINLEQFHYSVAFPCPFL